MTKRFFRIALRYCVAAIGPQDDNAHPEYGFLYFAPSLGNLGKGFVNLRANKRSHGTNGR